MYDDCATCYLPKGHDGAHSYKPADASEPPCPKCGTIFINCPPGTPKCMCPTTAAASEPEERGAGYEVAVGWRDRFHASERELKAACDHVERLCESREGKRTPIEKELADEELRDGEDKLAAALVHNTAQSAPAEETA